MSEELENPFMPEFPSLEAAPDSTGGAPEVEQSTTTPAKAVRLLNSEVKTHDEVLAYAAELERKQIEAEAKLSAFENVTSRFATQDTPAAQVAEELSEEEINSKYASRMFSEPAKVLKEFANDIEARVTQKATKSQEEKTFWSSFYDEFSDLNGLDEIVQLQLFKNQEQWKKVPVGQARKLLANAARSYVEKIRDLKTPTETLPSGPAATAGATRGSAPRVETTSVPMSFADQVRKVNKKTG